MGSPKFPNYQNCPTTVAIPRSLGKMLERRQILERHRIFLLSEEYPEYKRETGRSGKTILHTRLTVRKSRDEVSSHLGKDGKNNPKTDLPEVERHDATVVRPLSTAPAFSSQNQPLITILRSRFVTNKTAPRRPLVLPVLLTHSLPTTRPPTPSALCSRHCSYSSALRWF
ncbi:hypothetical protein BLNAU_16396 [Blattamonas nauphoetae]|uniref:Transposase n=1 Tax=Blattamonas nauphoetae TaxID=2049346 RepID=A0ABQ9XEK7_9EUKA|nr:hypothetical protein BLNAU_16396 [Blattamonas nauphoetae]